MGRMYLPCYRAGTEKVAELRRRHAPADLLPAVYGVRGLVDIVTARRRAAPGLRSRAEGWTVTRPGSRI